MQREVVRRDRRHEFPLDVPCSCRTAVDKHFREGVAQVLLARRAQVVPAQEQRNASGIRNREVAPVSDDITISIHTGHLRTPRGAGSMAR